MPSFPSHPIMASNIMSPHQDLDFPAQQSHQNSALIHEGTMLFEHVRAQFRIGISALDNLLRFMELNNNDCITKEYRRGIDELLDNLIAMARWLVSFLMSAAAGNEDLPWAKSAIVGLRVELHSYSWKVMRITKLLAQGRGR